MKKSIFFFLLVCSLCLNCYSQWERVDAIPDNIRINSIVLSGSNMIVSSQNSGVYVSHNNGSNWSYIHGGLPSFAKMTTLNNNVYAIGSNSNIYKSSDNGMNWFFQYSFAGGQLTSISNCGNNLVVGVVEGGPTIFYRIYYSTNSGSSWVQAYTSSNTGWVWNIISKDSIGFAGCHNGIFRSLDKGANWSKIGNNGAISFSVNVNDIYAGVSGYDFFLSTNNGNNWNLLNVPFNGIIWSIASLGNTVIIGSGTGSNISTNRGQSWNNFNEGFNPIPDIRALQIQNGYVYAGTFSKSLWRSIFPITGVSTISQEIPDIYKLFDNYPNPFNPQTKIKFAVPKASFTKLIIYDLLGREVTTLVNEELKPGTYEADWDASNYSSGVYFYKIISGDFVETKKMVLMK